MTELRFVELLDTSQPVRLRFGEAVPPEPPVRALNAYCGGAFAKAVPRSQVLASLWQEPTKRAVTYSAAWELARPSNRHLSAPFKRTSPLGASHGAPWQQGAQRTRFIVADAGSSTPRNTGFQSRHSDARPLSALNGAVWQRMTVTDGYHLAPSADAAPIRRDHSGVWCDATVINLYRAAPWQNATHLTPGSGASIWLPPAPPELERCYEPPNGAAVSIVFTQPFMLSSVIRFMCRERIADSYIPTRKIYMQVHELSCTRVSDGASVPITGYTLTADADSFGWSFSAQGPASLLDMFSTPSQLIDVTLDGLVWRIAVGRVTRDRSFGSNRVSISGSSQSVLLASPHRQAQSFLSAVDRTAQQLANDALALTGFTLDWQLTDWLVTGGAWSFQGTPLQAVQSIVEAAGGSLQSHRVNQQLIAMPRYPVLPWAITGATPVASIALAAVVTDSFELISQTEINGVYVSGESQGINGFVKRIGTAGDKQLPMITERLITHADAARQRGGAEIARAMSYIDMSVTLPVLTGGANPGVLPVNQVIEFVEPSLTWRGYTRGVQINVTQSRVRQQLKIERVL